MNTTKYKISLSPLDDDAQLIPVDGSGIMVNIAGQTGTVGGFTFGLSIRQLLDKVNVPLNALLNVIDASQNYVSLRTLTTGNIYVDRYASSDYYFEVVAENGNTIVYQLMPSAASNEAYVLSDVYSVLEEPLKIISNVATGTGVSLFFSNLLPVEGAVLKLINKSGQQRELGTLSLDDKLSVTSADGTVTVMYEISFIGEMSAYVASESFLVNQDQRTITVDNNTSVAALLSGLITAPEATMMLKDIDGNPKNSGSVLNTDYIVVTSGDGKYVVTYSINVIVSVTNILNDQIRVYPNPAEDILFVENAPMDTYIRICDITGRAYLLMPAIEVTGGIDLSGLSKGIYFLSIEKKNISLATKKLVVK